MRPVRHGSTILKVLLAVATATCLPLAAQDLTPQPSGLARLFATAVDAQGAPVSDLGKDDFVILEDGKPRTTTLYRVDQPLTVVVMIDRSASMIDTFGQLVSAVDAFAKTLGPDDQLRAGTFSDTVQFTSRFTSNHGEVIDELRRLPFGNATKLHDALVASFDELKDKPGLHVVITITDGEDTGSRTSRSKILERERMDDVVVYALGLETQYFDGAGLVRNRPGRGLKELAEQTGASYRDVRQIAAVATALIQVRRELSSHYVLGFTSPADGRVHALTVQTKRSGVTRSSTAVLLRKSLEALIVSRGPIQRRHLGAHQSQIHRHLTAVMRPVVDGVADHFVARLLHHHGAAREQAPLRHQMLVRRRLQRLARVRHGLVERGDVIATRAQ
jgi:VWFA-related protein